MTTAIRVVLAVIVTALSATFFLRHTNARAQPAQVSSVARSISITSADGRTIANKVAASPGAAPFKVTTIIGSEDQDHNWYYVAQYKVLSKDSGEGQALFRKDSGGSWTRLQQGGGSITGGKMTGAHAAFGALRGYGITPQNGAALLKGLDNANL